jgi:hypothetical protein
MAFEELKQRQSVMWGSAPFEDYVHWLADMHDDLVRRLDPKQGERWLDLATGTGEVAFRAADAGASGSPTRTRASTSCPRRWA